MADQAQPQEAAMTAFEQRIAPLLATLAGIERNEAALAQRSMQATARSATVTQSVELLAAQFPDVFLLDLLGKRDRVNSYWVLPPLAPPLRERWSARRSTVVDIECPALAAAGEATMGEAGRLAALQNSLGLRVARARRSRSTGDSTGRSTRRWRLFRFFSRQRLGTPSAAATGVDLDFVIKRLARLVETGRRIDQQQTELHALASEEV